MLIVLEDCIIGFSICNSQPIVEVTSINVRIISTHINVCVCVLFSLVKGKEERSTELCSGERRASQYTKQKVFIGGTKLFEKDSIEDKHD